MLNDPTDGMETATSTRFVARLMAVFITKLPTTLIFSGLAYNRAYLASPFGCGSGNGIAILCLSLKYFCASLIYRYCQL